MIEHRPAEQYFERGSAPQPIDLVMPTWNDVLSEITAAGSTHDTIRRRYLRALAARTRRNTIIYYSGWLQKVDVYRQQQFDFMVNDADKNGLMATIHKMDRTKGLDLILHTPGGDMAATESLIDYLRAMFGRDIRAIVPQIAMSAGTMIALACREIVMGETFKFRADRSTDRWRSRARCHGRVRQGDQRSIRCSGNSSDLANRHIQIRTGANQ